MTPTEIRTALIGFRTLLANEGTAISYQTLGQYRTMLLREFDALLTALPGETAPDDRTVTWTCGCSGSGYSAGLSSCPQHTNSTIAAGDTGPAPPRALVEVVREWQRTRNVIQAGDSEWPHKNAEDALLAYPLPAPEAPETPR